MDRQRKKSEQRFPSCIIHLEMLQNPIEDEDNEHHYMVARLRLGHGDRAIKVQAWRQQ